MNQLLQPIFDREAYEQAKKEGRLMATGLAAGPGAASGKVVFSASKAEEVGGQGQEGRAGPHRNQPRRSSRHDRRRRHSHLPRRRLQPRGPGRPPDGQGLRRRRRRDRRSTTRPAR